MRPLARECARWPMNPSAGWRRLHDTDPERDHRRIRRLKILMPLLLVVLIGLGALTGRLLNSSLVAVLFGAMAGAVAYTIVGYFLVIAVSRREAAR